MKPINFTNVFQILPSILAGILLIIVMVVQMNQPSATISHIDISTVYVEYVLSFIASFVLLYWMMTPIIYLFFDLMRGSSTNRTVNLRGYLFLSFYAVVAIILSPFGLLSIRFFIQDETYVKYISMTTIVSTLAVLYFTFRAALG